MSEERTISSMEASQEVKDLVAALCPWPVSNERAYAIVDDHMKELRLKKRAYKVSNNVMSHLAEAALEALHEIIDQLGPHWQQAFREPTVLAVQYAFRKEEEVCGNVSSAPCRRTPKHEDSSG